MNRSKLFLKNTIWELLYYIIVIMLGFLAPRYIILTYGSDVNGLSLTITQILNVILLLQAGATTAAVFSLFKPIANDDIEAISERVTASDMYFKKISYVFFVLMLIMAVVSSYTIKSHIPSHNIFIAFVVMGLKSFIDLCITSKYRIVFFAYQEKFIVSIATLCEQLVYYTLVFATIYLQWHYILLFIWFFTGCVVKIWILKQAYSKRHVDIKKSNNLITTVIKGKNYSLANEVAHSIITASIAILISFMYGLQESSVVSIYAIVFSALYLISTALYSSFSPSFAGLWAKGNATRAKEVFTIFQFFYVMMNTAFMMCSIYLIVPFVTLYTGGATDVNYANETLAVIYCLLGLFSAYRIPYNLIVSSCGYFKETWTQPMITLIISLCLSVGLGSINYAYILIGPAFFYLVNFLYQHYKLKKLCPVLISSRVFLEFAISLIGMLIAYVLSVIIPAPSEFIEWGICACISVLVVCLFLFTVCRTFLIGEYRLSINYIQSLRK